ncbi:hypothetical protein D9756_011401 [Leucocoprinus leucothites]|uniref:Uncharacterized protein n=1 Tax=Leucocoprinus leucothites TaxID=201217 RepID=A0A8H5CLT8_9AGAR|nr:hypothetical protein D9756_011401 [Leucoagaricus leucothites]
MKSLLPRSFSRSLPTILPSSRSNHDHILSLPDYYRDTRREVYGPYFSSETQFMRTMETLYDDYEEGSRASCLLDTWLPDEEDFETKSHSTESTLDASGLPSLCSSIYFDEVPISSSRSEKSDCLRLGRVLLQGFVSLFYGGRRHWRRKD